jgi:pimeloyl-ACP methyl ester carboxylesterase
VFLHGYGGNLLFNAYLVAAAFPDDFVICPGHALAWTPAATGYLDDVLAEVDRRLGPRRGKPWLIGLSAGGPAAFAAYDADPARFAGVALLATAPTDAQLRAAKPNLNVLFLAGRRDPRFPITVVRTAAHTLRATSPAVTLREADADHFFMLTMAKQTFDEVRSFMQLATPR